SSERSECVASKSIISFHVRLAAQMVNGTLWPQCYELTKKKKSQQDDGAHKKDRRRHSCTEMYALSNSLIVVDLSGTNKRKLAGSLPQDLRGQLNTDAKLPRRR